MRNERNKRKTVRNKRARDETSNNAKIA